MTHIEFRPLQVGEWIYHLNFHPGSPGAMEPEDVVLESRDGTSCLVVQRIRRTPEAQRLHEAREELLDRWKRGEPLPDPLPDWIVTGKVD